MMLVAALPACLHLLLGIAPSRWANRNVQLYGTLLQSAAGAAFVLAVFAAGLLCLEEASGAAALPPGPTASIAVYFDGLAATMLVLISGLGLTVVRFSRRYLDGDPAQGRFLKWMSLTLGGALWLVVATDLLVLTIAWMLTSFSLHQLLIHYPERSWAIWAARKKFLISRLGDMLLLSALALCYLHYGTADFEVLFRATAPVAGAFDVSPPSLIAWLLVLGAMTKSAQVPFHSWLPDTMETPTPVSALMHAGIINAGGFLILRLSPLVELAPEALVSLAVVGMLTSLLGSVAMLTQTSVKRALAYSTIGQMGFMMLQCGLGAYSAALLHLVAHSLYKAHAFLRSGTVTTAGQNQHCGSNAAATLGQLALAIAAATVCVVLASWLIGVDFVSKAGGPTLAVILVFALAHVLWQAFRTRTGAVILKALLAAFFVTVSYCAGLTVTELILNSSAVPDSTPRLIEHLAAVIVAVGFLSLFLLQVCLADSRGTWLQALHVHATHGFYLDIPARRITAWLWGHKSPVP